MQDLLSQEEIDALLHSVDEEEIESPETQHLGDVRPYDLSSQDRVIRGRMPTLEMINERFARHSRESLFNLLRRKVDVSIGGIQLMKFGDYTRSLYVPTSLNMVKISPLRGTAMFVLDAKLVFRLVDNYFGGEGADIRQEGRGFTPTEQHIVRRVLDQMFDDLNAAWATIFKVQFEYMSSEVNPALVNIVSLSEVVIVNTFRVELEGGGGELHMTMPYSMIEPIREMLDARVKGEAGESDARWTQSLREDLLDVDVELNCLIAERELKLAQVMELQEGDVIPVDLPENMLVTANSVPVLRGHLGVSDGNLALQVAHNVKSVPQV